MNKPRLFVGNFDFEHRLAHGDGPLPKKIERRGATLAASWLLIADPGDAFWWPYDEPSRFLDSTERLGLPRVTAVADPRPLAGTHNLIFWAQDAWARRASEEWGFMWKCCDPQVVARVNSRRFQTQLERELGVAPQGLQIVTNLDELSGAINALAIPNTNPTRKRGSKVIPPPLSHDQQDSSEVLNKSPAWILKAEFGTAGRESRRGWGRLTPQDVSWADKRFKKHLAIVVEPRLDAVAEAGVQFDVHQSGQIEFLGVVGCIACPNGTFSASQLLSKEQAGPWQEVISIASAAARHIAHEGYHGPLGIDAMRHYDENGVEKLRPIQDINARYTIGRLALGLRNYPCLMNRLNGTFTPATWP